MKNQQKAQGKWAEYYDNKSILDEITDESVYLSLDDNLRQDILSGKRKKNLRILPSRLIRYAVLPDKDAHDNNCCNGHPSPKQEWSAWKE